MIRERWAAWRERVRADKERRAREKWEASLLRCPRCKSTTITATSGSNWGFIGYTCESGHEFDVDYGGPY